MATIMQPLFHCDLQPQIQDTHGTTHTGTATRCRTQRRNQFAHETTPAAPAAQTRYLSSPPAATSHGKTQGFVLRLPPQNKAHATLMQLVQCILQHHVANPHLSGNTIWQQSCSHSTAICNHRFKTRMELRTQEQPLVAEHWGGTNSRMKRLQPHPPHTRGTFHRRLQPLYTEKHKVSCSGFLPKTKPQQHSCSHYNAFCSITWLTRISLRTWQHQMTTIMQPLFHCDLQPQIQDTHGTTHTGTATRCRTPRRNQFAHETTPAAPAAHTRYPSSPPAATSHGKTQGFVLRLPPQNKAPATLMQPLQCILQHHVANPHLSTHMAAPDDNNDAAIPLRSATAGSRHAWNYAHRNSHSLQNTEEEPIRAWNDSSRTRRTHEVPFIAACSHFTRKNTRFRAPASSPKQSPCNTHAAITMHFAASCG